MRCIIPVLLAAIITIEQCTPQTTPIADCYPADVMFIVPGSDDVSISEFDTLKRMIMILLRGMPVEESEFRIGVAPYGSDAGSLIFMSGNRMLIGESLMNLQKVGGNSKPETGLKKARNFLQYDKRYGVPQVAILIYKGVTSYSKQEARHAADSMSDHNIRVISVGIGSNDLESLAWSKEQAYTFPSVRALLRSARNIPEYICKAILTSKNQPGKNTQNTTTANPVIPGPTEIRKSLQQSGKDDVEDDTRICDQAIWKNNVGFAPVSDHIGRFAMCHVGTDNTIKVTYKTCPFGQYWNAADTTCVQFSRLNLVSDPCKNKSIVSHAYDGMDCREHWFCDDGKSVPKCCPPQTSYSKDKGCVSDPSCTNECSLPAPGRQGSNPFCQLKAIPGVPDKFRQRTVNGSWEVLDCAEGTAFREEDCGCSTFRTSDYMARQTQDSGTCSPELYLPFCDGIKDFSGKETYVNGIGHVQVREGKAYFDGNSFIHIPRFSGVEFGKVVVIKLKYAYEDNENYFENGDDDDDDDDDDEHALISNGNECHGSECEQSSISISTKEAKSVFRISSTNDDVTIVSEHSRTKRDAGDKIAVSDDDDIEHPEEEELSDIDNADVKQSVTNKSQYHDGLDLTSVIENPIDISMYEGTYEVDIPDDFIDIDSKFEQSDNSINNLLKKTSNYDIIIGPHDIINIEIPTPSSPLEENFENIGKQSNVKNKSDDNINNEEEDLNLADTTYEIITSPAIQSLENLDLNESPSHQDIIGDLNNYNYDLILNNGDSESIARMIDNMKEIRENEGYIADESRDNDIVLVNYVNENDTAKTDDVIPNSVKIADTVTDKMDKAADILTLDKKDDAHKVEMKEDNELDDNRGKDSNPNNYVVDTNVLQNQEKFDQSIKGTDFDDMDDSMNVVEVEKTDRKTELEVDEAMQGTEYENSEINAEPVTTDYNGNYVKDLNKEDDIWNQESPDVDDKNVNEKQRKADGDIIAGESSSATNTEKFEDAGDIIDEKTSFQSKELGDADRESKIVTTTSIEYTSEISNGKKSALDDVDRESNSATDNPIGYTHDISNDESSKEDSKETYLENNDSHNPLIEDTTNFDGADKEINVVTDFNVDSSMEDKINVVTKQREVNVTEKVDLQKVALPKEESGSVDRRDNDDDENANKLNDIQDENKIKKKQENVDKTVVESRQDILTNQKNMTSEETDMTDIVEIELNSQNKALTNETAPAANDNGLKKTKHSVQKIKKWKTVTLKVKDGVIQVTSDGRREIDRYLKGNIKSTVGAIQIGRGTGLKNFKGYMDEVYIYFCDPDQVTPEEKHRQILNERRLRSLSEKESGENFAEGCDDINPKAHEWLH